MKNPTERCCGGPSPRARRGESRFPLLPFLARPDVNKINPPLNQGSAREARLFFLELRDKAVTEGTTLGLSYPSRPSWLPSRAPGLASRSPVRCVLAGDFAWGSDWPRDTDGDNHIFLHMMNRVVCHFTFTRVFFIKIWIITIYLKRRIYMYSMYIRHGIYTRNLKYNKANLI